MNMKDKGLLLKLDELMKNRHKIYLKKYVKRTPRLLRTVTSQVRLVSRIFTDELIERMKSEFEDYVDQDGNIPPGLIGEMVSAELEDLLDKYLTGGGYFTIFDSDLDLANNIWNFSIGTKENKAASIESDFRRFVSGYPFRKFKEYVIKNFKRGNRIIVALKKFENYSINSEKKYPKTKIVLTVTINPITGAIIENA